MPSTLTIPFPLRLTEELRSELDRACRVVGKTAFGRPSRADVARMALERGLRALVQEMGTRMPIRQKTTGDALPHDEAWLNGGALVASELIPGMYDWGTLDPTQAGDPIFVVPGRGAYVAQ